MSRGDHLHGHGSVWLPASGLRSDFPAAPHQTLSPSAVYRAATSTRPCTVCCRGGADVEGTKALLFWVF